MSKESHIEHRNILTHSLINQLLKLQELFYYKYLTPQLLNEMVALFVAVLECFNQTYLPMRVYFLGKIQFLLSTPEAIKMLSSESEPPIDTHLLINGMKTNHLQIYEEGKVKERSNKIEMQMKFMREVESTVKNMSKEIDNVDKKDRQHNQLIGNMIKNQEEILNQRLANRNKKIRKQSADVNNKCDEDNQPIKKEQLVQVQKQLTIAIERYTVRLTEKHGKGTILNHNNQPQKGRVMHRNNKEDNQEEEEEQIKFTKNKIFMEKIEQHAAEHQKQQPIANRTSKLGTVTGHDPKDKGRVTVRKRNQQQEDI